jgi:hypothetical protein
MIVEFLNEAATELTEAALWYESKETGLGIRFRDEISHVVGRIAEDPLLWRLATATENPDTGNREWAHSHPRSSTCADPSPEPYSPSASARIVLSDTRWMVTPTAIAKRSTESQRRETRKSAEILIPAHRNASVTSRWRAVIPRCSR